VGTHGRNAITRNGEHLCYEQGMDGHYANWDFMDSILTRGEVENFISPTMKDKSDECDFSGNFAHIDYDRKIVYSGLESPAYYIHHPYELQRDFGLESNELTTELERLAEYTANLESLKAQGWHIYFNVTMCPPECNCPNSASNYYVCPHCLTAFKCVAKGLWICYYCGREMQVRCTPNDCPMCEQRVRCLSIPERALHCKDSWSQILSEGSRL